jgi:hypothetical protein
VTLESFPISKHRTYNIIYILLLMSTCLSLRFMTNNKNGFRYLPNPGPFGTYPERVLM